MSTPQPQSASGVDVAAVRAQAKKLRSQCDPECEGRCRVCPDTVIEDLLAALDQQQREIERLTAMLADQAVLPDLRLVLADLHQCREMSNFEAMDALVAETLPKLQRIIAQIEGA